jgi:DNA-binding LytR/AlgR family response regulator
MTTPIRLLIVEDDMIIAANISLQLTSLGYEVTGIVPRGEEAILHVQDNPPDIVLLDINLKGKLDGIETAEQMQQHGTIPIIYLTANADEATFDRAKTTHPHAFIAKPFRQIDLQRAIELTVSRMELNLDEQSELAHADSSPFMLSDRIFVRHKDRMVKIYLDAILYVEADRNYCRIFTHDKEYILATSLKTMEEKLPVQNFVRVHRSYVLNLAQVDEVAEQNVIVGGRAVPVSHTFRDELLKRIQTI